MVDLNVCLTFFSLLSDSPFRLRKISLLDLRWTDWTRSLRARAGPSKDYAE